MLYATIAKCNKFFNRFLFILQVIVSSYAVTPLSICRISLAFCGLSCSTSPWTDIVGILISERETPHKRWIIACHQLLDRHDARSYHSTLRVYTTHVFARIHTPCGELSLRWWLLQYKEYQSNLVFPHGAFVSRSEGWFPACAKLEKTCWLDWFLS